MWSPLFKVDREYQQARAIRSRRRGANGSRQEQGRGVRSRQKQKESRRGREEGESEAREMVWTQNVTWNLRLGVIILIWGVSYLRGVN